MQKAKPMIQRLESKDIPEIAHAFQHIGVGMTSDYGAAQKLYVLRGYIPDGLGLHWKDHHVHYHEDVVVDDDLALYLTKELK